jgi:hypothetical protein
MDEERLRRHDLTDEEWDRLVPATKRRWVATADKSAKGKGAPCPVRSRSALSATAMRN